jgi:hypothetical protein
MEKIMQGVKTSYSQQFHLIYDLSGVEREGELDVKVVKVIKSGNEITNKINIFAHKIFISFVANAKPGAYKDFYSKATTNLMRSIFPKKCKNRGKQLLRQKETPIKCMQCFVAYMRRYRAIQVPEELHSLDVAKSYMDVIDGEINGNSFNNNLTVSFFEFLTEASKEVIVKGGAEQVTEPQIKKECMVMVEDVLTVVQKESQEKLYSDVKLAKSIAKAMIEYFSGTGAASFAIRNYFAWLRNQPAQAFEKMEPVYLPIPEVKSYFAQLLYYLQTKPSLMKHVMVVSNFAKDGGFNEETVEGWEDKALLIAYGVHLRADFSVEFWKGGSLSEYSSYLRALIQVLKYSFSESEFLDLIEDLPEPLDFLFLLIDLHSDEVLEPTLEEEFMIKFMEFIDEEKIDLMIGQIKLILMDETFAVFVPALLVLENFISLSRDQITGKKEVGADGGVDRWFVF